MRQSYFGYLEGSQVFLITIFVEEIARVFEIILDLWLHRLNKEKFVSKLSIEVCTTNPNLIAAGFECRLYVDQDKVLTERV